MTPLLYKACLLLQSDRRCISSSVGGTLTVKEHCRETSYTYTHTREEQSCMRVWVPMRKRGKKPRSQPRYSARAKQSRRFRRRHPPLLPTAMYLGTTGSISCLFFVQSLSHSIRFPALLGPCSKMKSRRASTCNPLRRMPATEDKQERKESPPVVTFLPPPVA